MKPKNSFLSQGNYEVELNSGAAGRDFFMVTGPDGNAEVYRAINSGGGASPFMNDVRSSNYSVKPSALEKNLDSFNEVSNITFEQAYDTLSVGWGNQPRYWGNFIQNIPLYGVKESKDSVVNFVYPEGYFKFNNFIKGDDGVDTIRHFYNRGSIDNFADSSKLNATTILYGKGDGTPVDSLKFILPLTPR